MRLRVQNGRDDVAQPRVEDRIGLLPHAVALEAIANAHEVDGAPPAGSARHSPAKQMAVAEMRIKLEQARALFARAINEAGYDPSKDERLRAYAAQYTVMEYANDICRLAIRTCGGRSIMKALPLERLYRDSRCGALMLPWTAEICLERLGRESLFEPGEK